LPCSTVSDVSATAGGTLVAGVAVASSAMQQILCRYYLRKHAVSSHELLSATAPFQARFCSSQRVVVYVLRVLMLTWYHEPGELVRCM
jgi:hypothetical protein